MTESLGAARQRLASRFAEAGLSTPDLDARLLVCAAVQIDHAELIRESGAALDSRAAERLVGFAARRVQREPVSRIIGRREFWGLDFIVSDAVLDPRPETEGLVASALDAAGGRRAARLRILDLGVGSGAVIGALLKELPDAWGLGIDRSEAACTAARDNLKRHGMDRRATVLCANWGNALSAKFDLIVSNPPYVAAHEIGRLDREVRDYEPVVALDGGIDGLDAFRAIIPDLSRLLKPNGTICFECGAGQGAAIARLLKDHGLAGASLFKDLAGHDRIVVAIRAS